MHPDKRPLRHYFIFILILFSVYCEKQLFLFFFLQTGLYAGSAALQK